MKSPPSHWLARGIPTAGSVVPFRVEVPADRIDDLRQRLERTAFPQDFDNDDWRYGTNTAYLRELVEHWGTEYDWRKHEQAINGLPHYRTLIDDVPIHFVHVRGTGPNAMPLVLTHGWPWTFWDYRKIIGPLTDPAAHGAPDQPAFDVIVPSLPGFGFSTPTTKHVCWIDTAALWVRLVTEILGYDSFVASGGDWGRQITTQLGHAHADVVAAIHVNGAGTIGMWNSDRPWDVFGDPPPSLDAEQRARVIEFQRHYSSHVVVHVLGPQTIANALHDSPAGLCSWLLERRRWWSDCDGELERVYSRDDLLTTASLYWFTDTAVSSMRYYREATRHPWQPVHTSEPLVQVPSAVSVFARDAPLPPDEAVIRKLYNLQQLRVHPHGGHFAPFEVPDIVTQDIRDAFRTLT